MRVRTNLPTVQLLKKLKSLRHLRHLQDHTPLAILIIAAIIGTVAGMVGVLFQFAVNWVMDQRLQLVDHFSDNRWLYWFAAFAISAVMAATGYYLVRRFAPEAGGSGIPEIEGALVNLRPVRWRRVLPVKFIGGLGTLGSGMVLGREGPTVQLGGNIGRMLADIFGVRGNDNLHTLLATGAAAGLTAAFNAPLAGILFIVEEMRPQFRYNLISIKAVFVGVIMASVIYHMMLGQNSVFRIGQFAPAAVQTLWLYLLLGIIFGGVGVLFNQGILKAQSLFQRIYQSKPYYFVLTGAVIGGAFGIISLLFPELSSGGFRFIPDAVMGRYSLVMLSLIFVLRIVTTILCFSSGAPGGIFAPTLALGTILGMIFGLIAQHYFPEYALQLGAFAIAGMGALFAATVRAPLTGIVLVMEMTDNYQLILPMIITCFGATLIAQALGGRPLYSVLLERTLLRAKAEELQQSATTKTA